MAPFFLLRWIRLTLAIDDECWPFFFSISITTLWSSCLLRVQLKWRTLNSKPSLFFPHTFVLHAQREVSPASPPFLFSGYCWGVSSKNPRVYQQRYYNLLRFLVLLLFLLVARQLFFFFLPQYSMSRFSPQSLGLTGRCLMFGVPFLPASLKKLKRCSFSQKNPLFPLIVSFVTFLCSLNSYLSAIPPSQRKILSPPYSGITWSYGELVLLPLLDTFLFSFANPGAFSFHNTRRSLFLPIVNCCSSLFR